MHFTLKQFALKLSMHERRHIQIAQPRQGPRNKQQGARSLANEPYRLIQIPSVDGVPGASVCGGTVDFRQRHRQVSVAAPRMSASEVHLPGYVRFPVGAALPTIGIGLVAGGRRALTRNGTNVQTSLPTLVLVDSGIYRWTRNPLYVGGCLAQFGLAFMCGLDWLPLFFPVSMVVLHFGIVKREERYLERKFGDAYLSYASRVPRYTPLFI